MSLFRAKDGLFKTFTLPDGYVDMIQKSWTEQKVRCGHIHTNISAKCLSGMALYRNNFLTPLQATIVDVEGDHHIHLNKPESVDSIITDFLQSHSPDKTESESSNNQSSKL